MKRIKMALIALRKKLVPEINLTCVFEQDETTKGWIAHFDEFPDTYAQGDTKEQARQNLIYTLNVVLHAQADDSREIAVKVVGATRQAIKFKAAF